MEEKMIDLIRSQMMKIRVDQYLNNNQKRERLVALENLRRQIINELEEER